MTPDLARRVAITGVGVIGSFGSGTGAPRHVLSNTLGFGGVSCSIVMELEGDAGMRWRVRRTLECPGPDIGDTT